jgi:hypothetical protein
MIQAEGLASGVHLEEEDQEGQTESRREGLIFTK